MCYIMEIMDVFAKCPWGWAGIFLVLSCAVHKWSKTLQDDCHMFCFVKRDIKTLRNVSFL